MCPERDTNHGPGNYLPKPNKMPLSLAEGNTKNTILGGIVKRVINDKAASKNNKMLYVYYQKLLQDCENILLWINQKYSIPSWKED